MKKLLSILSVVILILSFVGCSSNPPTSTIGTNSSSNKQPSAITEPETMAKPVITDYSLTGMANVTFVNFVGVSPSGFYSPAGQYGVETATCIEIDLICPYCHDKVVEIVEFSEIPENLIGQQVFTWSDTAMCVDWGNKHSNDSNDVFQYSIMFTLNN